MSVGMRRLSVASASTHMPWVLGHPVPCHCMFVRVGVAFVSLCVLRKALVVKKNAGKWFVAHFVTVIQKSEHCGRAISACSLALRFSVPPSSPTRVAKRVVVRTGDRALKLH